MLCFTLLSPMDEKSWLVHFFLYTTKHKIKNHFYFPFHHYYYSSDRLDLSFFLPIMWCRIIGVQFSQSHKFITRLSGENVNCYQETIGSTIKGPIKSCAETNRLTRSTEYLCLSLYVLAGPIICQSFPEQFSLDYDVTVWS